MEAVAVYLHSTWRSSSTYVWAKFRPDGRYLCLFEPLAEHLATATDAVIAAFRPWSYAHHPEIGQPYQTEFLPLLRPEGGVPAFPADLVYHPYRAEPDDALPDLAAYFAELGAFARRRGQIPVFGLVRSALRVAWFRRHCPGLHITVRRDRRRIFLSCLRQAAKGNRYFLERAMVILGNNLDDPALAPLRGVIQPPPAGLPPAERDAFLARQAHAAEPAALYAVFYVLYRLAAAQTGQCDLDLDVDRMAADPAVARQAERRLAELTGADISFADCRPERYDDYLGWSEPFFADLEARLDALLPLPPASPPPVPDRQPDGAADFATLAAAGLARERDGRFGEAEVLYRRALECRPQEVAVIVKHAEMLSRLGLHAEAAERFGQALAQHPPDAGLCANLAGELAALGRSAEAEMAFRAALALAPDSGELHAKYGVALRAWKRPEEAVCQLRRGAELAPGNAAIWNNLGKVLMELGEIDGVHAALERAIAAEPDQPRHYRSLGECHRFQPDDPHLAALRGLAGRVDTLSDEDRIELHFALAKALDDVGDTAGAFDHWQRGNALKRAGLGYDEELVHRRLAQIRAAFTPQTVARLSGAGHSSPRPVFILGMPRAGSTLIEQILASHPDVAAAGEMDAFERLTAARLGPRFPDGLAELVDEDLRQLGQAYLDAIDREGGLEGAGPARRVTDKMPSNFVYTGLIHLALPQARIIYARRDPVETCMSCFTKLFSGSQPFAWDLGELGRYWRACDTHMAHWRDLLPPEVYLEIDYEAVVGDLEGQARRILAHCGLDWHPACLEFHRAGRPVRTASWAQVRQPLYRHALGRWRTYGRWLGPLLEALGLPGDDAPDSAASSGCSNVPQEAARPTASR